MKPRLLKPLAAAFVALAAAATLHAQFAPPPDNMIPANPSFEVEANANGWSDYINVGSAIVTAAEAFEYTYS